MSTSVTLVQIHTHSGHGQLKAHVSHMKCRFSSPATGPSVSGHCLTPVNPCLLTKLQNLQKPPLSRIVQLTTPTALGPVAVLVPVSDTHNPGLTRDLPLYLHTILGCNRTCGTALRNLSCQPAAWYEPETGFAECAGLAGPSLPLFNHVGATNTQPG